MEQQVHNLLGLMARARKIDVGTEKIYEGIKRQKYNAVVLAEDAKPNTRNKMERLASTHNVEIINLATKDELANAIGKTFTVAIAIKDTGFTKSLKKILEK